MCLVLVAHRAHSRYPLVVAANRDEWRARPADPLHRWPDALVAGRDRLAGGTWLAVRPDGAFAAVTNFREPDAPTGGRSRGELPLRVLRAPDLGEAVHDIARDAASYAGFHLIAGDTQALWHLSNRGEGPTRLPPGVWGVSNGPRAAPWPKVALGVAAFTAALTADNPDLDTLLALLCDRAVPPDEALPDTGVGLEWERGLAPRFVDLGPYGTRASTLVWVGDTIRVIERSWDPAGDTTEIRLNRARA